MILIADCGSTKTDWALCNGDDIIARARTQGLNPTHQESEEIFEILSAELPYDIITHTPRKIYFYGAGCAYDTANNRMRQALKGIFSTKEIHINSDLLAAARALCKHEEGIACILGTGSNSCLFDGEKIVENTPSLGYILGDEGSGAHLGRQLLSDCLKRQLPQPVREKFFQQYNLDIATILENTYHSPLPNRWLASFTPFLSENRNVPEIKVMLKKCFKQFFQRNTMVYRHSWLPIHIIGNVGLNFSEEIKETAESLGLSIGNIVDSPMCGLIEYHKQNK
ncbi:MAG: ATPase [Bacteroidaceae bacterium]|jgi:N-acetylglucosamine kinase-like BadF-type ATPase|nr:ATPase [Bacteroidaceae bacterium]